MTQPLSRRLWAVLAALALALVAAAAVATAPPAQAATAYIYTTFKGDAAADQELWVYTSSDATTFSALADTNYRGPSGALRDPSIIKRDGTYYIAYTVQSWTTQSTTFNIARSTNLRDWTHVTSVNAGVSGTAYTWAPEFFVDGSTVRVVVSLGTSGYQFTPYVYTAQSSDLSSWSGPTALGIPANHIDTYIVKSGSTYHAFVKNESTKWIERWTSTNLTSWTNQGNLWQQYHEGPSVVQQSDGTYRAYIDRYPSGGMWTSTSANLTSWSGLSQVGLLGLPARHGHPRHRLLGQRHRADHQPAQRPGARRAEPQHVERRAGGPVRVERRGVAALDRRGRRQRVRARRGRRTPASAWTGPGPRTAPTCSSGTATAAPTSSSRCRAPAAGTCGSSSGAPAGAWTCPGGRRRTAPS